MRFSLVFDNTGDTIPFEVVHNHELFEFFVDQTNQKNQNSFSNNRKLCRVVNKRLSELHSALSTVNEVLYDLVGINFKEFTDLEQYLDQHILNRIHEEWVFSQNRQVAVHDLRFSDRHSASSLGKRLHDLYPDDITLVRLTPIMHKLGLLVPYEEVNMGVHRLETCFNDGVLEFDADAKWEVFDNPFAKSMVSNHDVVNFGFHYTYVGRQYYNKFEYYDLDLECKDHYNYETLEYSFNLNLKNPETVAFSPEYLRWCEFHSVRPTSNQIPVANIVDIDRKLFEYRKILYRNSKADNRAKIILG